MGKTDRRSVLRRTYTSLGLGELVAVAAFSLVALATVVPKLDGDLELVVLTVGLLPLLLILVQAGAYWLLARSWVEARPMPRGLARLYRAFRALDVVVLLAAGAYLTPHLVGTGWVGYLAAGLWLFAVVEFVNYFVVRLSYPWRSWLARVGEWRTPRLVQDLRNADRPRP